MDATAPATTTEKAQASRELARERSAHAFILANLNLHAVLPRLAELCRFDHEARELAGRINMSIRFVVRHGPFVTLRVDQHGVAASFDRSVHFDVGLLFRSCEQLNAMFEGKSVVPIPFKGFVKLGRMKLFTQLSDRLTRYLKPKADDLAVPAFRAQHVEMLLLTGAAGAADIARFDRRLAKVRARLPDGTILFRVTPDGPQAHVVVRGGEITTGNGPIDDPAATLEIEGVDVALALLTNTIDSFAALGAGTVRASGLLPLVDEFNALLERVGHYLA
jgi:hypothetical protein